MNKAGQKWADEDHHLRVAPPNVAELEQQRDELLAALEDVLGMAKAHADRVYLDRSNAGQAATVLCRNSISKAHAAIARAKKGESA